MRRFMSRYANDGYEEADDVVCWIKPQCKRAETALPRR